MKRGIQKSVVVIDDDESVCEGCRQVLAHEGYRTAVARDGERGLRLVQKLRPAVVLVDLRMPGMSGMRVLEAINRIDPAITSIVITGYGTIPSAVEAMRLGARDYLCKPFDDVRLLGAVSAVFAPGRPEAELQPGPGEEAGDRGGSALLRILDRAAREPQFITRLTEGGSEALAGAGLDAGEQQALVSGDLMWLERHFGPLSARQKTWLTCRLEQERW